MLRLENQKCLRLVSDQSKPTVTNKLSFPDTINLLESQYILKHIPAYILHKQKTIIANKLLDL